MRQWILTVLFMGTALPATALQFGPANKSTLNGIDEIAIVVNQEGITRRQLAAEVARERRGLPAKLNMPEAMLEQQLVERVIMNHLLNQLTARLDLAASAEEIDQAIVGVAQQNRITPAQLLRNVRRDTGLNEAGYHAQIANTIVQDKLKQILVGKDIDISPADIDNQIAQIARQSNVQMVLQDLLLPIPQGDVTQRGEAINAQLRAVSEALAQANGDLQQVAAQLPNTRLVNLGVVNIAQIPPRFARAIATQPTGEVIDEPVIDKDGLHFLKVLSRQTDGKVVIPEAKVEHILLRAEGADDFAAQKQVIDALYNQLLQGADFADLALRYSQDPVSAARGGSLGWVAADQVLPAFAGAMRNVPLNTISEPFPTAYGWHIIRVADRREVDRSDDILRARIRDTLFNNYLEDAWQQRLLQLRQQAYVEFK